MSMPQAAQESSDSRETVVPTRDTFERMIATCKQNYAGSRMRAYLTLMYRTGLRPREALELDFSDIQTGRNGVSVIVRKPKGYRRKDNPSPRRRVGIDARTLETLTAWVARRGTHPGPLFCRKNRLAPTTSYMRQEIAKLARRAGVGRVHLHAMRHSFAADLYEETKDVLLVQRALGHKNLATTDRYLRSIGADPEVVRRTSERDW